MWPFTLRYAYARSGCSLSRDQQTTISPHEENQKRKPKRVLSQDDGSGVTQILGNTHAGRKASPGAEECECELEQTLGTRWHCLTGLRLLLETLGNVEIDPPEDRQNRPSFIN